MSSSPVPALASARSRRLFASLALAACLLAGTAAPISAAPASPFGEPELLLDLSHQSSLVVQGPFEVGEAAVFLAHGDPAFSTPGYLWRTDGTPEGTFSIHPPGVARFTGFLPADGPIQWLTAIDAGTDALSLWRTDGTAAGTRRLATDVRTGGPFQYHPDLGVLFFSAAPWLPGDQDLSKADFEPWVSDGTPAGTRRLRDLVADDASRPTIFRVAGDVMAFLATDPEQTAISLWTSDGTAAGTRLVLAPAGESFVELRVAGEQIFLVGRKPDQSLSLWGSDGTSAGTRPLAELGNPAAGGLLGAAFVGPLDAGRALWAVETDAVPASLWVSDGTAAGTRSLMPLADPSERPGRVFPFRGAFYFVANDGSTGRELWRTDGTPDGTEVAFETCAGPCGDLLYIAAALDDRLVIVASDAAFGTELRTTDGTAAGTELLADLCPGPCGSSIFGFHEEDGYAIFLASLPGYGGTPLFGIDLSTGETWQLTHFTSGVGFGSRLPPARAGGSYLVLGQQGGAAGLWAIAAPAHPAPPSGTWLASPQVPGFSFQVRISSTAGTLLGAREPSCIEETLCVSGALPGRSEVFARVVGPKPNGYLWPTLVKFSTSQVEVWVRQEATGEVRYYLLAGARPGFDELPGLFDRTGFLPAGAASSLDAAFRAAGAGAPLDEPPPAGAPVFTSPEFPGFRFQVRVTAGGEVQPVRAEARCIEETLCLSAALPGRSEVFVRLVGPKPNGRIWPTIVKFTTSEVEVWIEQIGSGAMRYYRIPGAAPGRDDLTGLFDREGFAP